MFEGLRGHAAEDGYSLNNASERDFWRFACLQPNARRGNLALSKNGNLRAIWRDGSGSQIGLQFLGTQIVQ